MEHAGLALPTTTPQNELGSVYCSKMLPRRSGSEGCKVSLIASFIIERNISLPSGCFLEFFLYLRVGVPCELFIGFPCRCPCGKAIHDSYVHYPNYPFPGRVANSVNRDSPIPPPSLPRNPCRAVFSRVIPPRYNFQLEWDWDSFAEYRLVRR